MRGVNEGYGLEPSIAGEYYATVVEKHAKSSGFLGYGLIAKEK